MLVFGAVLGCLIGAKNIAENPTSAPALLLLLPGLIASYVARPDQHALTTRLLNFARRLLLFTGGIAYVCATVVALDGTAKTGAALAHRTHLLQLVFLVSTVLSGIATLGLGLAWLPGRLWFRRLISLTWLRNLRDELKAEGFVRAVSVATPPDRAYLEVDRCRDDLLGLTDRNRVGPFPHDGALHGYVVVRTGPWPPGALR